MLTIKSLSLIDEKEVIEAKSNRKIVINTINAHSFNMARKDDAFAKALNSCDLLIPDGISIVLAKRLIEGKKLVRFTGYDLFLLELSILNKNGGRCFFLGSNSETLLKIKDRISNDFPAVEVETFSPPYKDSFSDEENELMASKINEFKPDLLFVGMTAPKQEKWVDENKNNLEVKGPICSVGAVFDFYSGNVKHAPSWVCNIGLEWLFRFLNEPKRLWRRYLIGNIIFIKNIIREYLDK